MHMMSACSLALRPLARSHQLGRLSCVLQRAGHRARFPGVRTLFSETGLWEKDYRAETRRKVEQWWHPRIMEQWRRDLPQEVNMLSRHITPIVVVLILLLLLLIFFYCYLSYVVI